MGSHTVFNAFLVALCMILSLQVAALETPESEKIAREYPCLLRQKGPWVYRASCDPCLYLRKLDVPESVRSVLPCYEQLPECSPCYSPTQCSTHKCWGGKCVYDTQASMDKCFPKPTKEECDPCGSVSECKTDKCWGGKCVYDTPASMAKCFPNPKKKECESCSRADECVTNKCWGGKCVYNNDASMKKCFPYPIDPCTVRMSADGTSRIKVCP